MILKGRIFITFAVFLPFFSHAQNLVPNSGFEIINTCAVGSSQQSVMATTGWFAASDINNTPDVFNPCFINPNLQQPATFAGNSFPHSGSTMAGIGQNSSSNYREMISTHLSMALRKDSLYCVSFFVKHSDLYSIDSWSQNLSLVFSSQPLLASQMPSIQPHISSDTFITGNDWLEITGYYIAQGFENQVNIGYFGAENTYNTGNPTIYYFIDDISIYKCNRDSLFPILLDLPNVFTPDNDGTNDQYLIKNNNLKTLDITILNRWGNVISQYNGLTAVWDGRNANGDEVTEGVYFVKAVAESVFGDVLNKQQVVQVFRYP